MIETPLYGGEVVLEFDERRHQYRARIKGRRYKVPSVTRICSIIDKSGPLINWAINQTLDVIKGAIGPGAEYSETYLEEVFRAAKGQARGLKSEAGSKGREVHQSVEAILRGSCEPVVDPRAESVVAWLSANRYTVRGIERRVYSRKHRYSGTLDCIGEVDGRLVLLDWKTSKGVYPEFRLQTAAYVKAYEEETGETIDRRIILRLCESGVEPHEYPRITLRKDFKAFLGAKALFEQIQAIEKENRKK